MNRTSATEKLLENTKTRRLFGAKYLWMLGRMIPISDRFLYNSESYIAYMTHGTQALQLLTLN
jgi:hypothetical protein